MNLVARGWSRSLAHAAYVRAHTSDPRAQEWEGRTVAFFERAARAQRDLKWAQIWFKQLATFHQRPNDRRGGWPPSQCDVIGMDRELGLSRVRRAERRIRYIRIGGRARELANDQRPTLIPRLDARDPWRDWSEDRDGMGMSREISRSPRWHRVVDGGASELNRCAGRLAAADSGAARSTPRNPWTLWFFRSPAPIHHRLRFSPRSSRPSPADCLPRRHP